MCMSGILIVLMIIAMLAVVGSLGLGLYAMTRGGEFNRQHGNKFMRARVMLQAAALVLFALAMLAGKK